MLFIGLQAFIQVVVTEYLGYFYEILKIKENLLIIKEI